MFSFPPIAVVGVSALFPGSLNAEHFWRNIVGGSDLLSDVPESHRNVRDNYDAELDPPGKTHARRDSFLPFDLSLMDFGIPPSVVPTTDAAQLLALAVAEQVLEDVAGGDFSHLDRDRISVVLGVSSTAEMVANMSDVLPDSWWDRALRGKERDAAADASRQESTFAGLLGNVAVGRIADRFGLGGTSCVVDAAAASSVAAVEIALEELYLGDSEMVITGGVELLDDILMLRGVGGAAALSPLGDCGLLSGTADETMPAEGLAMMALKRLEDAERDDDQIYAIIGGSAASSNHGVEIACSPSLAGQVKALRGDYEAAGLSDLQDPQLRALRSVKSQVEQTKSASSACELFKAVMALHHKILPPTIKVDPALDVDKSSSYLSRQAMPWIAEVGVPRRAAVSSVGIGGTNYLVTLEEYSGSGDRAWRHRSWKSELVVLGASTATDLADKSRSLAASLSDDADMLRYIAHATQLCYDPAQQHRLALVADDVAGLRSMLDEAAGRLVAECDVAPFASPLGYFYSAQESAPVALLFSGQGSQYVGMGADIPQLFEPALFPWEMARASLLDADHDLHEIVWPREVFADQAPESETTLARTEWAQPAIAAHSLSLLKIFRALGIKPIAVGGHGSGEVMALCAAGVVDDEAALQIARQRGALIAETDRSREGSVCAFRDYLAGIPFNTPTVPVLANASASPYDGDADAMRARLAGQLAQPLRFAGQVRAMWASGVRTFVEVGPDDVLTNLLGECLEGLRHNAVALDRKNTDGIRALWLGLAQLVAAGVPMNLTSLWADYQLVDDPRTRRRPNPILTMNGVDHGEPGRTAGRMTTAQSAITGTSSDADGQPSAHRANGNGHHAA